ncbi:MAG: sugar ABC transporter ATP-binding protein [Phycisphaerae bacterium]|nr:sugar ABC transporter ATP-binding protein [Phycisphaerae bacterium]
MSDTPAPRLAMRGIHKAFSGVEVLRNVDFELAPGEVHALVGENGAGKSTLIKILGGVHTDYSGRILLDGRPVRFSGPRDAETHGVAVIHQELSLAGDMSVAENILLGREPRGVLGLLDRRAMRRSAEQVLQDRLGLELDVDRRVADLPISMQQMVEIAKTLGREASILVMDEPTSALSEADAERLFAVIRQLRDDGVSIIYISHRMEEIYKLADRITVLRDGELVGMSAAADLPLDELIKWMVGRSIDEFVAHGTHTPGEELMRVEDLWLREPRSQRWLVSAASFNVRAGEIVGLAGLMGSGNSELLGAVYGRFGTPQRGRVFIHGTSLAKPTPRVSLDHGVALLTNDRKSSGLVLPMSALHNASLATLARATRAGVLSGTLERRRSQPLIDRMNVRAPSLEADVATLSGGNQQKILLARWLMAEPRVLLLDEPTRGIDVAAKADVYRLLEELTSAGLGIVLITSELPELLNLADRIIVMHRGRMQAELSRTEATQENVMRAALGTADLRAAPVGG